MTDTTPQPLPPELARYFWEYDPASLDLVRSRHTVIRRLLESGDWDATRWLIQNVSEDELRAFLVRRAGRGLTPKRLRYWGVILGLPRDEVTAWIRAQQQNPWARRPQG